MGNSHRSKFNDFTKERTLASIITLLRKKERSIAEIQRETKQKRSTLIYYLNNLEAKGFIEKERIETKVTGRPTMIRLKKNKLQEIRNQEKQKQKAEEKIELKILNHLKSGENNAFKLRTKFDKEDSSGVDDDSFSILFNKNEKFDLIVTINKNGQDFLKNHKQRKRKP